LGSLFKEELIRLHSKSWTSRFSLWSYPNYPGTL